MFIRKHFSKLILLPFLASPLGALAAPAYKVAFAPAGFTASHMNNVGQVVGTSGDAAAIWSGKTVTDISALLPSSRGLGINNRGDIVGVSIEPPGPLPGSPPLHTAFVHTRAGVRYIRLELPFQEYSEAVAINDAGQVAGTGHPPVGEAWRGFLNSRGLTRFIGTFGGEWSHARAINSAGQVVGAAAYPIQQPGAYRQQAFLYEDGVLKDLGTLGGLNSDAFDINDAGQIVGYADTAPVSPHESGSWHAFLYEQGTMKDLGSLGGGYSSEIAINNAGVVVGQSGGAAFVYAHGKMTDLNTRARLPEGWTLVSALDINDSGQILARACHFEDCYWARLTRRHGATAPEDSDEDEDEDDDDKDED